jgi:hypothetical protein
MTAAEQQLQLCDQRVRIARALLLLQVSGPDRSVSLADLVTMAGVLHDETTADSVSALKLQVAQAELERLENGKGEVSTAAVESRYGDPGNDFPGSDTEF